MKHKGPSNKVLLVDADILLYKFAFPHHQTIEWDSETSSEVINADRAVEELDFFVEFLMEKTKTRSCRLCLSSDFNFRYLVLPTYKHNRVETEKPYLFQHLKDHVESNYDIVSWKWYEADDVLGVLSTGSPGKYIIASIDKDLKQIPGQLFNWNKGKMVTVTPEEGSYYHLQQTLMGDPTDGYHGCPKIGPKKASILLDEFLMGSDGKLLKSPDMAPVWDAIVKQYERRELNGTEALRQARVARICQHGQYNPGGVQPTLWNPYPGYQP
jgi:DNA polymerase-1